MTSSEPRRAASPETWAPARRAVQRVLRPIEHFLHVEASSGIALLISAIVALVWANSASASSYDALWHAPVVLGLGPWTATTTVHFWINDGLMVIFFFVVGLEIRREIHEGELADVRRAALPIAAAIGGMIVPALIYFAFNRGLPTQGGWGVPMATDIAFAVGVLALLGKRVPAALRVLLLALAIIDDIGAILVIAIFYSSGVSPVGFAVVAGGIALVLLFQKVGVRHAPLYVLPGVVIWAGCLLAGIHPTIAGVIVGMLTPARPWFGEDGFVTAAREAIEEFTARTEKGDHRAEDLLGALRHVRTAQREAVAPTVRLQAMLHPYVAFGIMPLFALANAGVAIDGSSFASPELFPVFAGVTLGLVLGKPLGVVLMCLLTAKLKLATIPKGVTFAGLALVGGVAGIGFTMAIFIAGLAFSAPAPLAAAKLGVLVASFVAGVAALIAGRLVLGPPSADAAQTPSEAEASHEH